MRKVWGIMLLMMVFGLVARAQGPAVSYVVPLVPEYNTGYTQLICMDNEGNVIVANQFNDDTLKLGNLRLYNHSVKNYSDVYVMKYNQSGQLLWANSYGGVFEDRISAITTDSKGNIIFCLTFNSPLMQIGPYQVLNSDSNYEASWSDFVMVKLDKNGKFLWLRGEYAHGGTESISTLTCDHKDNLIVSGWYNSWKLSIGDKTIKYSDGYNSTDDFIFKTDPDGKVEWLQRIGESLSVDLIKHVCVDSNNNIILSGSSEIYYGRDFEIGQTIVKKNSWKRNEYVAKLDDKGLLIWCHPSATKYEKGNRMLNDLIVDKDNGIYQSGYFYDTLQIADTIFISKGGSDIFIQKFTSSGISEWVKTFGGTGSDFSPVFSADKNGILFLNNLTSDSITLGYYRLYLKGKQSSYLGHMNFSGDIDWAFGLNSNDRVTGCRVSANQQGEIAILFTTQSDTVECRNTFVFPENHEGHEYLMKLGPDAFTRVKTISNSPSLLVYPNPITNETILQFNEPQSNVTLRILNVQGQEVINEIIQGKEHPLAKYQLSKGLYFLEVTGVGWRKVTRVEF